MIISDEKILRSPNEDVKTTEITGLISLLEKGLNYSAIIGKPGIGLACPQIGINKKAAIVRIPNQGGSLLSVNLINAKIKKGYDPFIFKNEGCLSFDNKLNDTIRYQEIHVINNAVEPHAFIATGLMSIAIQHELDHLDGVLFFDRIIKNNVSKLKLKPNDPCFCGSGKKYKKCPCH